MNWHNLDKNKCPKCGKDLTVAYNPMTKKFTCVCGFQIYEERMKEIITKSLDEQAPRESHYRPNDEVPEIQP